MSLINAMKLPIWNKNNHGAVINFLMDEYYTKMSNASTFSLLEIAGFAYKVFDASLKEEIMKILIEVSRPYVEMETLYNNDMGTNVNDTLFFKSRTINENQLKMVIFYPFHQLPVGKIPL